MSLLVTESFLNITMDNGNKIYDKQSGAIHNLDVISVNDTRQGNYITTSGGDQYSIPLSITSGKKADVVRIVFRIGSLTELNAMVSSISAHRYVSHPKNIFLVNSIVFINSGDNYFKEFFKGYEGNAGTNWIVSSFSVRRSVKDRLYKGDLVLKRWYDG